MLAVTGGKGGCGKTTTALALARALANSGADPLVVDADTDCPDAHLLAAVDREPTWDALDDETVLDCLPQRAPALGGAAVLPAGSADGLADALATVRRWHGPVLVDCPAGAGPGATVPLRAADGTVLATVADPESLTDTAKSARVARRLGAPPVAAVVRADRVQPTLPFEAPVVERVPRVDIEPTATRAIDVVLSHPGVTGAYQGVATAVGRQRESSW